jgi:hypothetical protein
VIAMLTRPRSRTRTIAVALIGAITVAEVVRLRDRGER